MSDGRGWGRVRLGDVAEVIRGVTFPAKDKAAQPAEGLVACLRTTNVQKDVEWDDLLYIPAKYARDESKWVQHGDILISTANSKERVGKVAQVDDVPVAAIIGGFIGLIRPRADVLPKFLYYYLAAPRTQAALRGLASQTINIANLNTATVSEFNVPLPPLPEQQRIADLLAEADAARRLQAEANIALKQLITSTLNKMLDNAELQGWEEVTLTDVADVIRGITFPAEDKHSQQLPDHVACLRTANIQERIVWDDLIYIPREYVRDASKWVQEGDILVSTTNSSSLVGKVAFVDKLPVEATFGGFNSVIRPNSSSFGLARYLYHYLAHPPMQARLRSLASQTININSTALKSLKVMMPPLVERAKIAELFEAVDELRLHITIIEREQTDLFHSLLTRLFTPSAPPPVASSATAEMTAFSRSLERTQKEVTEFRAALQRVSIRMPDVITADFAALGAKMSAQSQPRLNIPTLAAGLRQYAASGQATLASLRAVVDQSSERTQAAMASLRAAIKQAASQPSPKLRLDLGAAQQAGRRIQAVATASVEAEKQAEEEQRKRKTPVLGKDTPIRDRMVGQLSLWDAAQSYADEPFNLFAISETVTAPGQSGNQPVVRSQLALLIALGVVTADRLEGGEYWSSYTRYQQSEFEAEADAEDEPEVAA